MCPLASLILIEESKLYLSAFSDYNFKILIEISSFLNI